MPKDESGPPALVGRLGLAFAYVCFAVAIASLSASAYLLPLDRKAKIFLGFGSFILVTMVAFLAIVTRLVTRAPPCGTPAGKSRRKAAPAEPPDGADSSQRPR